MLFHRNRFFNFYCLFCQRFSSAYLLKAFLLPQHVHTTLFIRCGKPDLTRWCLCSLHAGIQMSPDEVVDSRDSCRHSIVEGTVVVPIRICRRISVLAPSCSRALSHNLQLTSDRCLIFASHLATGILPVITIISRLLCLQGTREAFKYFPKNILLSFFRNKKSAVHVPYAGCLIFACSALACTHWHDVKNFLSSIQVFCCKTFTRS